jgi:hypothetical protein
MPPAQFSKDLLAANVLGCTIPKWRAGSAMP